jgi:hypothetical protein
MTDREESLEANRLGRLSASQLEALEDRLANRRQSLLGRISQGWDPVAKDVEAGRVEAIEGAISKRIFQSSDMKLLVLGIVTKRSYRLYVENAQDGKQEFRTLGHLFEAADPGATVRLFYLPLSRLAVNFERLSPDLDAFRADGPPASAHRSVPGDLREAILGTWRSPVLTVTFGPDGGLTLRMAQGDQTGRWSVGDDGRLHADLMGTQITAEASIGDDGWLTLGIDGDWYRLQR